MTATATEMAASILIAPCGCRFEGRFGNSTACTVLTPAATGRQRTTHYASARKRAEKETAR